MSSLLPQTVGMSDTNNPRRRGRPAAKSRHKPAWQPRVHHDIAEQLQQLAERNRTDRTTEAERLLREGLEAVGLWPPPPTNE